MLPAPLWPRSDRPLFGQDGKGYSVWKCWWCGSGEQRSRHHLFVKCRAREIQIRELWRSVGKACKWKHPRAPTVRLLFEDERATPAVLNFLRDTKVGHMVTLAPPEEEGKWGGGWRRESYGPRRRAREFVAMRVGQGHPRVYLSFVFSFVSFPLSNFYLAEKRKPH